MKHADFTDNALENAAAEVREQLLKAPDTQDDTAFPFSEDFENSMDAMLRKNRRKSNATIGFKRAMAACLAFVLCMTAWLAIDVDARGAIINWAEQLGNIASWQDLSNEDYYKRPVPEYVPGWLPGEGFREIDRQWGDSDCTAVYQKGDDPSTRFWISCHAVSNYYTVDIKEEDYLYQNVDLNYTLHTAKDTTQPSILTWSFPQQHLGFAMYFYFDSDTAIGIAKSISTVTPMGAAIGYRELSYIPTYYVTFNYCTWTEDEFIQRYDYNYYCDCMWELDETGKYCPPATCNHDEERLQGDPFIFAYHRVDANASYCAPTNKMYTTNTVSVNGMEALEYTANGEAKNLAKYLIWNDGECEYLLRYHFDTDTAIAIAEGVQ